MTSQRVPPDSVEKRQSKFGVKKVVRGAVKLGWVVPAVIAAIAETDRIHADAEDINKRSR